MADLVRKTMGRFLEENAKSHPNKTAVVYVDKGIRYTWRQLNKVCDATAKGFLALGIRPKDHIAIWGTNRPEWFITQLAAAKIGAALITMNPEWKADELEYALKQSDTRLLVMQDKFVKESGNQSFEYNYVETLKKVIPEINKCNGLGLYSEKFPKLGNVILISEKKQKGMFLWKNLWPISLVIKDIDYNKIKKSVTPDDVLMIQYTSGTTGFPKGAMLTHYNVINNAIGGAENMELTYKDKICGPVPYYHIFGSVLLNTCCLVTGAAIVIPAEHFNPRKTLEAIEEEKCTAIHGVPTMFITEFADSEFSRFELKSLRTGIIAGAPCPIQLMEEIVNKMGAKKITIVYGLSEASPITHQTRPNDSIERRVSSVGKPLTHVEAKIVNPNNFEEVPLGEVGEIWVKGYNVMPGYYKKPEETQKAIVEDNWLRTGDLGTKDEDGYFRIAGRLKEMIIVGGHNVYPAEVEQALLSIFADEIEAIQVVGVPHESLQEVPAAIIKLKSIGTPATSNLSLVRIKEECADKMEWPKIPRYVKFVEDFSIAMTVTGKIMKKTLKEILIKELGLEKLAQIKTA